MCQDCSLSTVSVDRRGPSAMPLFTGTGRACGREKEEACTRKKPVREGPTQRWVAPSYPYRRNGTMPPSIDSVACNPFGGNTLCMQGRHGRVWFVGKSPRQGLACCADHRRSGRLRRSTSPRPWDIARSTAACLCDLIESNPISSRRLEPIDRGLNSAWYPTCASSLRGLLRLLSADSSSAGQSPFANDLP